MRDLNLEDGRTVPARCLTVRFSRSSGPGGQNVNKIESRVNLRVDLSDLPEPDRNRIREKLPGRLDGEGRLQVTADTHREQARNLELAHERLEKLISTALKREKRRKRTRPTKASREKRLSAKKHRGQIKKWRSEPPS